MSRLRDQYANYMALKMIEKLGNQKPTDEQVAFMESLFTKVAIIQSISFDHQLTNREIVCLYWAALGKTSIETAKLLNVQPSTVEKHRKDAKQKLGCKSMAEAVFRGLQLGYIKANVKDEQNI